MERHEEIRSLFPVCSVQTFLDAGMSNGGCRLAQEALQQYFEEWFAGKNGGKTAWNRAAQEVRQLAAALLGGVSPDGIAITKNTVEGLNILAQGFPWQPGDNLVLNDQEHTSNLMPWLALKDRGVECRVVKAVDGVLSPERIGAAMDSRTRIVAVSHVQNATGYRSDLAALGRLCRQHGAFLVVDAIQSLGVCPFDAPGWGVDAVAAGGHKGLLALPGVGILYAAPRLLELLQPVYAGASAAAEIGRDSWTNRCTRPDCAQKLEISNLNYPGLYALRAGLQLLLELGVDRIWAHVSALAAELDAGLRAIGYRVVTPEDPAHRAGVVSVSVPDPAGMKAWFGQRGITIGKMDAGYVRFSLGLASNRADVQTALAAARDYYDRFVK